MAGQKNPQRSAEDKGRKTSKLHSLFIYCLLYFFLTGELGLV